MFQVNRLGQTFFAEVVGLDLAQSLDEAAFARVKQAHLEHGVLVFRDQRLTPGQHIAFSARFGPLQIHPMGQFNLEGAPQILLVSNDKHPDGRPVGIADAGRYWHTDMSYMKDMTAACRDLAPDMLRKLRAHRGWCTTSRAAGRASPRRTAYARRRRRKNWTAIRRSSIR
jgi:hypothetical protein